MTIVWNSKLELVEGSEEELISIRKMGWMFPQSPTSDGCLFVLLGKFIFIFFFSCFFVCLFVYLFFYFYNI